MKEQLVLRVVDKLLAHSVCCLGCTSNCTVKSAPAAAFRQA